MENTQQIGNQSLDWTFSCNGSQYCNITAPENSTRVRNIEITTWDIIGIVYSSLASLFAIVGNAILVITIVRRRALHRVPFFLVSSLAVKDFSFALLSIVLVAPGMVVGYWYFSHESCIFFGFLSTWLSYVETLCLVTISLDRYVACVYPLRYYQILTPKKLWAMVIVSWTYALAWSLTPLVGFGGYVYVVTPPICQLSWSPDVMDIAYAFTVGALLVIPGTGIIVFCYWRIYASARKVLQLPTMSDRTVNQGMNQTPRSNKATRTIALVTGIYFLCWVPYTAIRISRLFVHNFNHNKALTTFETATLYTFTVANFANPIIYGIYNREFRQELINMFQKY